MRHTSIMVLTIIALILGVARGGTASAQESDAGATPTVPDPAECAVEPRSLAELRALAEIALATPESEPPSTPAASPVAFTPPAGEPADPATSAAVTDMVRESLACVNATNILALYALQTDDFIRLQFSELRGSIDAVGGLDQVLGVYATPLPAMAPDDQLGFSAVHNVEVLGDGRVGAIVDIIVGSGAGGQGVRQDYYVFRQQDGQYLIDGGAIDIFDQGLLGSGTPTP